MSDSRGDDADIHAYPGQDRPAGPGAEDMSQPDPPDGDDVALPSEVEGREDNARADDLTQRTADTDR